MTSSFKPEVVEASIAGMVFRKIVFVGERYLVACHNKADHLAGMHPMVTAWQTEEQAALSTRRPATGIRFPRVGQS